jgi:H+/Cl- antiporter ClcA
VTDTVPPPPVAPAPPALPTPNPIELVRSRSYLALVVLGAVIGVPIAVVAYFFLKLVSEAQTWVFVTAPGELGLHPVPVWWLLVPLFVSGLVVGLTIEHLHGTAGHKPAEGFKAAGAVDPIDLPGIVLASLATLCMGAVLGPEAPLIAIGSGLGVLAVHLVKRDAPPMAALVIGAAGSFTAIATLLGSPIVGAFLLMEAAGLGGPMLGVVLVPGLVAAGVGSLIFVGLDAWTGFGTFALSIGPIPHFSTPTVGEFGWAIAIGIVAAVLGSLIRRGALLAQPIVERRKVLLTPFVGLFVAGVAILFVEVTGQASSYVLFSGQAQLPALVQHAATWSVGTVVLLLACKGIAYGASLSSFRGGPIFPGIFVGATLGIAFSHLPGLPLIAGVGIGIGAMTCAMLGLPLASVLLASLLLSGDGVTLMPLVIVGVAVTYITSAHLAPKPDPIPSASPAT